MLRIAPRLLAVTCLFASLTLFAQTRPDFSGKWIDVQTVAGKDVIEETLVVAQDAKGFSFTSYAQNGRAGERLALTFDGTPATQPPRPERPETETTSTASWKGAALFVVTTLKLKGQVQAVTERTWSIDGTKRLVIETLRKPAGRPTTTSTTVYRRQ